MSAIIGNRPPRPPRERMRVVCATVLCIGGLLLMYAGFVVDPMGQIDPSVLVASGEAMTFSGALFGIASRK